MIEQKRAIGRWVLVVLGASAALVAVGVSSASASDDWAPVYDPNCARDPEYCPPHHRTAVSLVREPGTDVLTGQASLDIEWSDKNFVMVSGNTADLDPDGHSVMMQVRYWVKLSNGWQQHYRYVARTRGAGADGRGVLKLNRSRHPITRVVMRVCVFEKRKRLYCDPQWR